MRISIAWVWDGVGIRLYGDEVIFVRIKTHSQRNIRGMIRQ